MADANRSKPPAGRAPNSSPAPPSKTPAKAPAKVPPKPAAKATAKPAASEPPVDPRVALARQYMQSASAELAQKEAEQPRSRRKASAATGGRPGAFAFSVVPATFVHVVLAAIVLTFAACAALYCGILMNRMDTFDFGRIIAMPTGFVIAASLSYLSICYLGVIESTAAGRTEVDVLHGDWRDWFWTLPMTLGMAAVAAGIGWILSLVLPVSVWLLISISLFLFYPVLQMSALETGTPFVPLSVIVVRSIVKHPYAWLVLYGLAFALVGALRGLIPVLWDGTTVGAFRTIIVEGPLVVVALFLYAWLLGQLANLISTGKEA